MEPAQIEHTTAYRRKHKESRYSVAEAANEEYRKLILALQAEMKELKTENSKLGAAIASLCLGRDGNGLLNIGEVLAIQTTTKKLCGIYFLIKNSEIVYVGQSANVWGRVANHQSKGVDFDCVAYDQYPECDLNRMEVLYMNKFNPPLNRSKAGYTGRYGFPIELQP